MKKALLFLTAVFLFTAFFPQTTFAFDQRCWEKSKCIEERTTKRGYSDQKPEDGFVQNSETIRACGETVEIEGKKEEMGFCLPVGKTETKISFGGKRKFSDVADFIQYMYRYSIMAATIVGVLMIIVAGFQWALSGGNSSTIESARKKISGALMGLTIAMLSYSILYFVNPNLVSFRLPEIWMINTVETLKSQYCADQVEPGKAPINLTKFKQQDEKIDSVEAKNRLSGPYNTPSNEALCQTYYYIENGGGQFCHGTVCPNNFVCGPMPDDSGYDQCYQGQIVGVLVEGGGLRASEEWDEFPWAEKGREDLMGICNSGKVFDISTDSEGVANEQSQVYHFVMRITAGNDVIETVKGKIEEECEGTEKEFFKGFVIQVEMNEDGDATSEEHYIGKAGKNGNVGIDFGDDEAFEFIAPQVKPDFLFSWEQFKTRGIVFKINQREIEDLDDSSQIALRQAEDIRASIYRKLGIIK